VPAGHEVQRVSEVECSIEVVPFGHFEHSQFLKQFEVTAVQVANSPLFVVVVVVVVVLEVLNIYIYVDMRFKK
jgi:hypothetical protein